MKKSSQSLLAHFEELQSKEDGTLAGGYMSILTGLGLDPVQYRARANDATNIDCTNKEKCIGTNTGLCVNENVCEDPPAIIRAYDDRFVFLDKTDTP